MVNNTLQQDLLKHMMIDQIDIDMEELVQNDTGKHLIFFFFFFSLALCTILIFLFANVL